MSGLLERLRHAVGLGTTSEVPDIAPVPIMHFGYGGSALCGAMGIIRWASQIVAVTCPTCRERYHLLKIKAHVSER